MHNAPDQRAKIPPFLVFTKGGKGRDVVFRGLAVPGVESDPGDDLVAVWRSTKRAALPELPGEVHDPGHRNGVTPMDRRCTDRRTTSFHCTVCWLTWVEDGAYKPLTAEPTIEYRTKQQQLPAAGRDESLVQCVYAHFKDNPYGFEHCAARLAGIMDPNINIETVTRPSVDGGRDAIGTYRVGLSRLCFIPAGLMY